MNEGKDINLIAIKSLIEYIDNRDIAEGGIFLDDDNAEFVADILRYHYKSLISENKMKQVARMFGKKLNESFIVRATIYKGEYETEVAFTENGIKYIGGKTLNWPDDGLIDWLLIGKAVIITNESYRQVSKASRNGVTR